jgi:acetyl/propionyl-CoA carboxylase alpha subunit/acetyl-CoA carboxylase carboxyltransferase component
VPTVLVANRGEVAVRVQRAAADLGWRSVAVHAQDDTSSLHVEGADEVRALPGSGPAAYLDLDALLDVAWRAGATHLHPGWGFLSESPDLATACADRGVVLVGPSAEHLALFGDKTAARAHARRAGVQVLGGSDGPVGPAETEDFVRRHGPALLKAVSGGGGRGMRVVRDPADVAAAHAAAAAEARTATGDAAVYVEALLEGARHLEVQLLGDGERVAHLWERDCSVQRRFQKVVETAPAPALDAALRRRVLDAGLRVLRGTGYRGLATVELLLGPDGDLRFLEVNPRLQVEHTVTEALTGMDLVVAQLRLADGASLVDLGLGTADDPGAPPPAGRAVQARVVLTGTPGRLAEFAPPTGPWVRVDTALRAGLLPSASFDPLLAKVVVSGPGDVLARAGRAVREFRIAGAPTNLHELEAVLARPELADGVDTAWLERVLPQGPAADGPVLLAPASGVVTEVAVASGEQVAAGAVLLLVEAMKMQFPVRAAASGTVAAVHVRPGDAVAEGQPVAVVDADGTSSDAAADEVDLDAVRDDLAEVRRRWALTRDEARPEAVARRHAAGGRTARENVDDLLDPGTLTEYGAFTVAAQRARRSHDELLARSPADGLVTGVGTVAGDTTAVAAYDYTVLAGTQGFRNHAKLDRLVELVHRWRWPLVLFAEGGGGRPGDTETPWASALAVPTFSRFAGLSGRVPLVGIAHGNCFAGNAALLGCCDLVVATRGSSIGMGGPAMIEGGGLGRFRPEEVGPADVLAGNGVVDVLVDDEAQAVEVAQRYLAHVRRPVVEEWSCADQRLLRTVVPAERKQVYDVRALLRVLADTGSVLELRPGFGRGVVTALARVEGHAVGVLANDPAVVGGAVTAEGSDKAARFLALCEVHRLPVLSLVDTPGFMVGPDSEREAAVRRMSRLFLRAAHLTVPVLAVSVRRGYGLGAMAMTGGQFLSPALHVSWPSGEFGGMGLEGAVRLAMRRELAAIEDEDERERTFRAMVAFAYATGRAVNVAEHLELDAVIDPADTRDWVVRGLRASPVPPGPPEGTYLDSW